MSDSPGGEVNADREPSIWEWVTPRTRHEWIIAVLIAGCVLVLSLTAGTCSIRVTSTPTPTTTEVRQ